MKRNILRTTSIILLLTSIFLITGCSIIKDSISKSSTPTQSNGKTVVFKSSDGKESITAPSSWKDDPNLNSIAIIQVDNGAQEKYVMVIGEGKDSFSSDFKLSDYTSLVKGNIINKVTNATTTDIKDTSLSGNNAQYFEVTGEVQKIKITYMIMTIEASNKFYQIYGWTLTPKFEANKSDLKAVMDSFKISQ